MPNRRRILPAAWQLRPGRRGRAGRDRDTDGGGAAGFCAQCAGPVEDASAPCPWCGVEPRRSGRPRAASLGVLVVIGAVVAAVAGGVGGSTERVTATGMRGDQGRTGTTSSQAVRSFREVRWRSGGSGVGLAPSRVGEARRAGDSIIVPTPAGLVALNAITGERRWSVAQVSGTPAVVGNSVLVSTGDRLLVLSAVDGRVLRRIPIPGGKPDDPASPVVSGSGVAVVGTGPLIGIDVSRGAEVWRRDGELRAEAAGQEVILAESDRGERTLALSAETGETRWDREGELPTWTPRATTEDIAVLPDGDGYSAFDLASGSRLASTGTCEATVPPSAHDGDFAVLCENPQRAFLRIYSAEDEDFARVVATTGSLLEGLTDDLTGIALVAADEVALRFEDSFGVLADGGPTGEGERANVEPTDEVQPRWGTGLAGGRGPPTLVGDLLITGSEDGITAFSTLQGTRQWQTPLDMASPWWRYREPLAAPPVVISSQAQVHAYDIASGTRRWMVTDSGLSPGRLRSDGDTVYTLAGSALEARRTDGSLRWSTDADEMIGFFGSVLAASDRGIVTRFEDGGGFTSLRVLSPDTGEFLEGGTVQIDMGLGLMPSAARGGRLYLHGTLSDGTDRVAGFSHAQDGSLRRRWTASVGANSLVAVDSGVLAVGFDHVTALADSDGSRRWRLQLPKPVGAPPAVTDEALLVPTGGNRVERYERSSRQRTWTLRTDTPTTTPPTVAGDTGYVGTAGGQVVAFDVSSGEVVERADAGSAPVGGITVARGTVFVRVTDGGLVALGQTP